MFKKFSLSLVSVLSCLGLGQSQLALADPIGISVSSQADYIQPEQSDDVLQEFNLKPRLNVWGFTGKETLAEGQLLLPLYSIHEDAIFAVLEGNYVHDDGNWFIGAGPGYRKVVSDRIYGSHALVELLNTPHNSFTVIDPGLEMLGNVWDINLNGYIPLNNKKKIGQGGWAGDDFGDYSNARPTGHDYYDHFIQEYEQVGRGADFSVARVIPHIEDAKLRLGVYHFDTSDSGSVNGATTKLSYFLNKYSSIELQNNYDNVNHNQFLAGIKLTLGGYNKAEKNLYGITTRLLDPIEHVLDTGGMIMVKSYVDKGEQKERDNIWYFKADAGTTAQQGSGTAEDPFIDFNPANYAAINPNIGVIDPQPLLYFAPGSYSFSGFNPTDDRFALPNGWGMYGRTADYKISAVGDERAEFTGGLDLNYTTGQGNVPTTVNSIRIINPSTPTSNTDAALYANNASNVILQNIDFEASGIGIYAESSTLNFDTIKFINGTNDVISSSTNIGSITDSYSTSYGIIAHSSTINFNGGTNNISSTSYNTTNSGISNSTSYGIEAFNSTINFNDGINNISASSFSENMGALDASISLSNGIYVDYSTVNFKDGANNISSSTAIGAILGNESIFASDESDGIDASNSIVNFDGGTNNISSTSSNASLAADTNYSYGINAANSTTINFNGGTNNISSSGSVLDPTSLGINAIDSVVNFNGGTNNISSFNSAFTNEDMDNISISYGIYAYKSTVNFNDGTNNISSSSSASSNNGTNITSTSYGIAAYNNSIVNFNGSINNISSATSTSGIGAILQASQNYGIYASGSSTAVNFIGGTNTISTSTSTSGGGTIHSQNYGIYADSSTINFANSSSNKVTIKVSGGQAQYGIYATNTAKIQQNNINFTTFADMQQYITFIGGSGSISGDAVDWVGHFTAPWPPMAQEPPQEQSKAQSSNHQLHSHVVKVAIRHNGIIEPQESLQ